jgi:hypothetical protein
MALMLVAILVIRQCRGNEDPAPKPRVTNPTRPKDPASNPTNRDKGFDRRTSFLDYSPVAGCNAGRSPNLKWKRSCWKGRLIIRKAIYRMPVVHVMLSKG